MKFFGVVWLGGGDGLKELCVLCRIVGFKVGGELRRGSELNGVGGLREAIKEKNQFLFVTPPCIFCNPLRNFFLVF